MHTHTYVCVSVCVGDAFSYFLHFMCLKTCKSFRKFLILLQ